MSLFPDEVEYFPEELVSPYRGVGPEPKSPNFETIMFQLNVEPCPYLEKTANMMNCRIYYDRPLACKQYPFGLIAVKGGRVPIFECDPDCKAVRDSGNIKFKIPEQEFEDCNLLFERTAKLRSGNKVWVFDLEHAEWFPSNTRARH